MFSQVHIALEQLILIPNTGMQGARGAPGPQGDKGQSGFDGAPGREGSQGDTGVDGEQGAHGLQGRQGPNGAPGPVGDKGQAGPKGPLVMSLTIMLNARLEFTQSSNCNPFRMKLPGSIKEFTICYYTI